MVVLRQINPAIRQAKGTAALPSMMDQLPYE